MKMKSKFDIISNIFKLKVENFKILTLKFECNINIHLLIADQMMKMPLVMNHEMTTRTQNLELSPIIVIYV